MRVSSHKRARTSGGIAVLLTGVMITGAMMAVGLAIDVGMMYAVKTKLSAAADAAALAGTRALGRAGSGSRRRDDSGNTRHGCRSHREYCRWLDRRLKPCGGGLLV